MNAHNKLQFLTLKSTKWNSSIALKLEPNDINIITALIYQCS